MKNIPAFKFLKIKKSGLTLEEPAMIVLVVVKHELSTAVANEAVSAIRARTECNSVADHVPRDGTNASID